MNRLVLVSALTGRASCLIANIRLVGAAITVSCRLIASLVSLL